MADELLRLVADENRRALLLALLEREPDASLAVPEDVEGDTSSGTEYVELIHNHLPKLDAAGLIIWDRDAGTIERGPTFFEARPLLAFLREHADDLPEELSGADASRPRQILRS